MSVPQQAPRQRGNGQPIQAISEFLSQDEIRDMTQRARGEAQAKVLLSFGVPFRLIGKRLLVSRYHAREWLAGHAITPSRDPNMGAIR